jgi:hypothetical protein
VSEAGRLAAMWADRRPAAGILRCRRGSITVEGALLISFLFVLLVGVIDFGLAFRRHSELENAVRAGTQYAMVRRPQQGDVEPIRDAVYQTAPFAEGTLGTGLEIEFYCECPDGTPAECSAPGGVALCAGGVERHALLRVRLTETFPLLLVYPGFGTHVDLAAEGSVRLN